MKLPTTTIAATCPRCRHSDQYGEELIGRYTLCTNCRCRFYIEVPALAAAQPGPAIAGPPIMAKPPPETTLDDLLWDTQRGGKILLQSLQRQEQALDRLSWFALALILLVLANLIGVLAILIR